MKKTYIIPTILGLSLTSAVYAENPFMQMFEDTKEVMGTVMDKVTGKPEEKAEEPGPVAKMVDSMAEKMAADSDDDEVSSLVAFDLETRRLITAGNPANGKMLIKEQKCVKCHGELGVSEDVDDPNIGGQLAAYNFKQLMDYKNGHRESRTMQKAVRDLSEKDMADMSAWYASVPSPKPMHKDSLIAQQLVYKGDPKRMLKPCGSCHGRDGEGRAHAASKLTGQNRGYFITAMEEFKEGDRGNDVYSRMRLISEVLTDEEIAAIADYYSTKPLEE